MRAEIITIGDEILIGQTVDTNSAWLAKRLNSIGVSVAQITSIADTREHILSSLKEASERADLILMTGGLGPTRDDITKKTLCEYFDTELVMHDDIRERIESYFAGRGIPILEVNRQQAALPAKCTPVENLRGTAQGMWFDHEGTVFVSMPGVPFEMKGIVDNHLLRMIQERFETPHIEHLTMMTQGIGESRLSDMVQDWEDSLEAERISIAYLPSYTSVKVRLTSIGPDAEAIKAKVRRKADEFISLAGKYVYAEQDEAIQFTLSRLLTNQGLTVASAESCTGGRIASALTAIPGASAYFMGSTIAYHNDIKEGELGVKHETFLAHGAVSEAIVREMAEGARSKFGTDYAVATSGVAGPSGGSDEKPVGLVWIAVSSAKGTIAKEFRFGKDRARNIDRAVHMALSMVRDEILG
ncbi:MAG: competence/damage-inducible protein A [Flavobacteriales bacterium]|nr:competence/damage-inducible protein A [Flavobacteriales bacterium]